MRRQQNKSDEAGANQDHNPQGGSNSPARAGMLIRQQRRAEEERQASVAQEVGSEATESAAANPGTEDRVPQAIVSNARAVPDDFVETPAPSRGPGSRPGNKQGEKPAGKPGKPEADNPFANYVPSPTAKPAKMRQRHWGLFAFFLLMVVLPGVVTAWYMYTRAADQYESDIGFASRTESASPTFSVLGALGGFGGIGSSSGANMDILYQFIGSQELVTRVDKKLDLRKLWSKPGNDPVLTFPTDGKIEDLVKYWTRMVVPSYDGSTGLMTVKVFAFDPLDARAISQAVLDESTAIINELSVTAQQDATKYGSATLKKAQDEMQAAQKAVTDFRISNHIVDPTDTLASASLVVTSLVQQLGAAEVDLDMLAGTISDSDPRIATLNRRIEVIQKRIEEERSKVGGLADPNAPGYANLVSKYATLTMANDFAQKAYMTALAAYDQAVSDAQHKTAYLATFISPTLAESSLAPNRGLWIFLVSLLGFLGWAASAMIYYALRDRR